MSSSRQMSVMWTKRKFLYQVLRSVFGTAKSRECLLNFSRFHTATVRN